MRFGVAIALCFALPAAAGGNDAFPWGRGAFNSNYRPPGSVPAHTPDWRIYQPSWRGGFVSYPARQHVTPVAPFPYYYPSYYPYGSPYYGFQPAQPDPAPPPAPAPPQVIVFERPARAEPAPEPVLPPPPQVVVVQVPVPAAAPEPPAKAPAPPEPPQAKSPPRDVFYWTDADGVVHYSTRLPAGVKAAKIGSK